MTAKGRPMSLVAATKRHEQTKRVVEILAENRNGLTSLQIANLLGDRLRRDLLSRLQKEGKIKQKRGMLADGKICFLYVLNQSRGNQVA
jgi:hypothetical protein